MTPKRKSLSALARLTASHMRLLKVQRGLIEEIGHLRKLILDRGSCLEKLERVVIEANLRNGSPNWLEELTDIVTAANGKRSPYGREPNDWPRL